MQFVTSNQTKLNEYRRFGMPGIDIEKGVDLDEVKSEDVYTVAIYKVLDADVDRMIEDTSLHIDGETVGTDIKWLIDTNADFSKFAGKRAVWQVIMAVNDGQTIKLYDGTVHGTMTDRLLHVTDGIGFDQYFIPDGTDLTLYELLKISQDAKDEFSARKAVATEWLHDNYSRVVNISDVPKWTGDMQHA